MTTSPFVRAPDHFTLSLDHHVEGLVTAPFESNWGTTDELLCKFEGILIGKSTDDEPLVISLAPTLDKRRTYAWPSGPAFLAATLALLAASHGWSLHCERDSDQAVPHQVTDMRSLESLMAQVVDVCCSGVGVVPTFVANAFSGTNS
ncbi:hypothetical protein [Variovorax sp. CY25R-8]|uniref:hypothetical protein n=1 Tax=Variovorax sp. CY25R-8 TaxID=2855501 RepID=UPI0021BB05C9|nr:hypothetical protein [Variovorax sp. CY25R-8]MCT8176348.1 hypothetical protein [Variovorax sp. CY25R-8]